MSGLQPRDKLGLEAADCLGVQVTSFLWNINARRDNLIMALFRGTIIWRADLNGNFLAVGISYKLAVMLLNVIG